MQWRSPCVQATDIRALHSVRTHFFLTYAFEGTQLVCVVGLPSLVLMLSCVHLFSGPCITEREISSLVCIRRVHVGFPLRTDRPVRTISKTWVCLIAGRRFPPHKASYTRGTRIGVGAIDRGEGRNPNQRWQREHITSRRCVSRPFLAVIQSNPQSVGGDRMIPVSLRRFDHSCVPVGGSGCSSVLSGVATIRAYFVLRIPFFRTSCT